MTISAQVVQYPMQLKHLTTTSSLWPGFQFRRSGEKSVQSVERKCFRRSGRDYVLRCCNSRKAVDIGEAAFITSLNLMSRMLFSSDFASYDTYSSQEIKNVVFAVSTCLGLPNLSDYFPVLESIDPQGIMRNSKPCCQSLFDIFDVIIKERLLARERSSETKKNDVLEALLDEHVKNDSEFSLDILKHLLFVSINSPSS
ncbi:OLC1v1038996C1 [Oldenlandia corymbosa var. corymbosa]|uniref:OLC1v1038996C1 n=1 Tax=Oldenlandia corymbosa var. corymbosa TaxID=529605 RepID=A0AAV1D285_OLDCO|nr:OLC1v1038996C1 [Oldenlandia corymbosa var. corymbosa]